jgi:hypothetical protein
MEADQFPSLRDQFNVRLGKWLAGSFNISADFRVKFPIHLHLIPLLFLIERRIFFYYHSYTSIRVM